MFSNLRKEAMRILIILQEEKIDWAFAKRTDKCEKRTFFLYKFVGWLLEEKKKRPDQNIIIV